MEDDDYYDEDAYEYDDAADDWEVEAQEMEKQAEAEEAARQARLDKLATRAPVKQKETVEDIMPEDVERAVAEMRQVANDIASGGDLLSGKKADMLGHHKVESADDVEEVAARIVDRLTSLSNTANYAELITDVMERLAGKLTSTQQINGEIDRVHLCAETLKKQAKTRAKHVEKTTTAKKDTLDLDNFEDRGGAAVAEDAKEELGW